MKDHFAGLAAAAAASGRSGIEGFPAGLPLLSHMQVSAQAAWPCCQGVNSFAFYLKQVAALVDAKKSILMEKN